MLRLFSLWHDSKHSSATDRANALHGWTSAAAFGRHRDLLRVLHFALLLTFDAISFGHKIFLRSS